MSKMAVTTMLLSMVFGVSALIAAQPEVRDCSNIPESDLHLLDSKLASSAGEKKGIERNKVISLFSDNYFLDIASGGRIGSKKASHVFIYF